MIHYISAAAISAALLAAAAPASAVSIIDARCPSVAQAAGGCAFSGNDNDVALVEAVYNGSTKPLRPIDLDLLFKINIPNGFNEAAGGTVTLPGFGSVTLDPGSRSGSWTLFGGIVADFFSAKGGNQFNLVKLTTPASAGSFSTANLVGGRGAPALSHIQFYGGMGGGVVPEPATWAMLIAGFGLVGASLRRRRGVALAIA